MKKFPAYGAITTMVTCMVWVLTVGDGAYCAEHEGFFIPVNEVFKLPKPKTDGSTSLEKALAARRSVRKYTSDSLSLAEVSQLLWAAQGLTDPGAGLRTAPSAGALYPLTVHVAVGRVEQLPKGLYRYRPGDNYLEKFGEQDVRPALSQAAFNQEWIQQAAMVIVLSADYNKTMRKYGEKAHRFVDIEAGAAAENVYLQATSLGLGTVAVGAFDEGKVAKLVPIAKTEKVVLLMPVGRK